MSFTWVEPFAGAAAVALRLMGGRHLVPPCAWMGGKRRYARAILDAMGVPEGRPGLVVLNDAGPWGWVWQQVFDQGQRERLCALLRSWADEHPRELWQRLVSDDPYEEPAERAAQWLWLQARSASGIPIWWDGWRFADAKGRHASDRGEDMRSPGHRAMRERWVSTSPQQAGGVRDAKHAEDTRGWRSGGAREACQKGLANTATIAERIEDIARCAELTKVLVYNSAAEGLEPAGGFVYLDPPYVGATGYGWDCPREAVVSMAQAAHGRGSVVAVSEAEPLTELSGWHHVELTLPGERSKPEWLTLNRKPARMPEKQGELFA